MRIYSLFLLLTVFMLGCDEDVPPIENEEEIITDVTLRFTPVAGGTDILAAATDPDGEGPNGIEITQDATLEANTEYSLTIVLSNSINGVDISAEVEAEGEEHKFVFEFVDGLFSNPTGDGNIDLASDPINYLDIDSNGLPIGLSTTWTTGDGISVSSGTFRVVLKHQPGMKTENSGYLEGETDIDLTWPITIQ